MEEDDAIAPRRLGRILYFAIFILFPTVLVVGVFHARGWGANFYMCGSFALVSFLVGLRFLTMKVSLGISSVTIETIFGGAEYFYVDFVSIGSSDGRGGFSLYVALQDKSSFTIPAIFSRDQISEFARVMAQRSPNARMDPYTSYKARP